MLNSFGIGNYLGYDHPTGRPGFIPSLRIITIDGIINHGKLRLQFQILLVREKF